MCDRPDVLMMTKLTRTLTFLLFIGLTSFTVRAQYGIQNLPYEDLRPYHFGFLIGIHSQDLILDHSGTPDEKGNRWYGSVPSYSPGFSVGVLGDLRITDFLSLRSTPCIHFGSKDITMRSDIPGNPPISATIRSNYILMPLLLRYRGARMDNYRPYLVSGFSAGMDVGRDKQQPLLLKPVNLYWEFGVGCDIYMPYFRLVPELKFSLGLGNILEHKRSDDTEAYLKYSNALDAVTSRLIVFSLQFE